MIKYIGLGLIGLCCVLRGYQAACSLKKREQKLRAAASFIAALSSELAFTLASPSELLELLSRRPEYESLPFLVYTRQQLECGQPFPLAMAYGVEKDYIYWDAEDKKPLLEVSGILGATDLQSQLNALSRAQHRLEERRCQAAELLKSHGRLYQTLGVSAGAALVLLLL